MAAAVGQGVAAITPLVERHIIDESIIAQTAPIAPWIALLVVAGVVRFVTAYVRRYWAGRVSLDVQYDLRTAVYDNLQRLDFARHDELQTGQLVSRAISDIGLIQGLLAFLPIVLANVLFFAVALVIMVWLSPLLTLVALAITPLLAAGVAAAARPSVFPATWDAQQQAGVVAGVVEESVSGVRVVKGFGQEEREVNRLAAAAEGLLRQPGAGGAAPGPLLSRRSQTIPSARPGRRCWCSAAGWPSRARSRLGTFLAFSTYVTQLQAPVRMLTGLLTIGQQARAGVERVFDLLDSTPLVTESPGCRRPRAPTPTGRGHVRRRDVRLPRDPSRCSTAFSLRRSRRARRSRWWARRDRGSPPSPCSCPASTTCSPARSPIDGVDVVDVTLDSLRRQIGVVFEDSFLFSDSIRTNIAYGRPDATDDEVEAAARAAEADEFIAELPDGLRHGRRRTGPHAVGRAAPAHRAGPRPAHRPRDPGARRRHLGRRQPDRARDPRDAPPRRSPGGPPSSSRTGGRRSAWPTASPSSTTAGSSTSAPTTSSRNGVALFRLLLSGPGDDAEAVDAVDECAPDGTARR